LSATQFNARLQITLEKISPAKRKEKQKKTYVEPQLKGKGNDRKVCVRAL
jgi:hypothetical protein